MLWNQCFIEQSGTYVSIKQLKLEEVLVKIFWHQRGCPRMKSGIKGDVYNNNELVRHKICHMEDIDLEVKHAGEIKSHKKHTDPVDELLIEIFILESKYVMESKLF